MLNNIIFRVENFYKFLLKFLKLLDLFDLNDKFIILTNKNNYYQTVYVFNRADFGYLYKYCVNFGSFFSFNEQLGFYFYKIIGKEIEIYTAVETGVAPESVAGIKNMLELIRFL